MTDLLVANWPMLNVLKRLNGLCNAFILTVILVLALMVVSASTAQAYTLMYSLSPDRANAMPLDQAVIDGTVYGFIDQDSGLQQVRFFVDGIEVKVENRAPWDLGGTASNKDSLPYDTTRLTDASHEIAALLIANDGTEQRITADFTVVNNGPLLISNLASMSLVSPESNNVVSSLTITESSGRLVNINTTTNVSWLTVNPVSGTTPASIEITANPSGLGDGTHQAEINISAMGYVPLIVPLSLSVGNNADQLHLAWVNDPATSLTAVWFTPGFDTPSVLEYRALGASAWQSAAGNPRHSNSDGFYHQVSFSGLLPNTSYEYRVKLSASSFSKTYLTQTAPAASTEGFDVVYVADTGLVGREDGLATGTQQVINEIAQIKPGLLLVGGDYAYFDTDKRFVTLERSIDAWFRQMLPISTSSPMMSTYGNHEILHGEGFAAWAARFPTPSGWNGGAMYSFDIGDVHFVSVYGIHESLSLAQSGIDWLRNDIETANAAGARWIIPFLHAAPFSEGTNHPSALLLRNQLGPLFESLGVKLVLSSHDQSFERTFPLVDVPATNTPTSNALSCYNFSEGVTWLKVSPGGKLSNISSGFSPWKSSVQPNWTATRDNTMHHYTHLQFNTVGDLVVDTYGVDGSGAAPVLQDSFRYSLNACPGEFELSPQTLSFQLQETETATKPISISFGGENTAFNVTGLPSWLTLNNTSGITPQTLEVTANANGLAPGNYTALLNIEGEGSNTAALPVSLNVSSDTFQLLIADNALRDFPLALDGAVLKGSTYIFTAPDEGVSRVLFYVDDPSATGLPLKTENNAPYDIAGTKSDRSAEPFDTTSLVDGEHTITAKLDLDNGTYVLLTATVLVANSDPAFQLTPSSINLFIQEPNTSASAAALLSFNTGESIEFSAQSNASWLTVSPASGITSSNLDLNVDASILAFGHYSALVNIAGSSGETIALPVSLEYTALTSSNFDLFVSSNSDRSEGVALEGALLSGEVYIYVSPESNISKASFYLDDPSLSGSAIKIEGRAPWDFAGTGPEPERPAYPYDVSQLASGSHTITVVLITDTGTETISRSFAIP